VLAAPARAGRSKTRVSLEVGVEESSGVFKFVSIGELAETTTQMIALNLQSRTNLHGRPQETRRNGLERMEQIILQQARDYLAEVREGFVLTARTAQAADQAELQFLIQRVLLDWNQLSRELGLEESDEPTKGGAQAGADNPSGEVERVRQQLLAYSMAAVALGYLPRLPTEHVTFPYNYGTPPSYADIPTPDSAGEMLWRIEELEQMVWQLMSRDLQGLVERKYGALRRTYGFFESSALLANREAERFGMKKKNRPLAFL
jgi:hypothetical protein